MTQEDVFIGEKALAWCNAAQRLPFSIFIIFSLLKDSVYGYDPLHIHDENIYVYDNKH